MSSILGGFEALLYTSSTKTGAATNVGVVTRVNPVFEPNNINARGTGSRGLYDILLGMAEPQFTMDMMPTLATFLSSYQNGLTYIPFLHLRIGGTYGITWTNVKVNTCSSEGRAGEAITSTMELWADLGEALAAASWGASVTTPLRWLDSQLDIAGSTEDEWHSWRYEVSNNLQRLANVSTRGTRDIKARHRDVTGLITMDLADFTEFTALMNVAGADPAKFNITIDLDGTDLLNANCRWGRIEAPSGPEDLILKRFPFTALDLS